MRTPIAATAPRSTAAHDGRARVGFVLEQTLGHRTHAANLQAVLAGPAVAQGLSATWLPVDHDTAGLAGRVPVYGSNWTVRAGLRARTSVARSHRRTPFDALFVHTQVPAVLLGRLMDRIPTVVSLDATPRQYDALGEAYGHEQGGPGIESLKWRLNRRCFGRAAGLVTWSAWARQGLIDDYGIDPDMITVIPPGVRVADWQPPVARARTDGPVRILFVGGDLVRKGGDVLLQAVAGLRARRRHHAGGTLPEITVDLVTQTAVPPTEGVTAHRGLRPNSPELRQLYWRADIFCLPTMGDCLPMVLAEAGAAGLPMVATTVGAIDELVRDGESGLLIPPGDATALERALHRLVDDADLRHRFGLGARSLVGREHDLERNAARLVELLRAAAGRHPGAGGAPTTAKLAPIGGGR